MRISDWSSDVCSSDLGKSSPRPRTAPPARRRRQALKRERKGATARAAARHSWGGIRVGFRGEGRVLLAEFYACRARRRCNSVRSEEHTSELQSLMRISYAVFCLKNKKKKQTRDKLEDK